MHPLDASLYTERATMNAKQLCHCNSVFLFLVWVFGTKIHFQIGLYSYSNLYGHECWIMNERVRSRVQAAEVGFLRRIGGLTLLDNVKSADICESLNMNRCFSD